MTAAMLVLWVWAMADPGTGAISIPPDSDPVARWVAIGLLVFWAISPLALARIQKTKSGSNVVGEKPLPPSEALTTRLDVNQGYLERYIESLDARVRDTEAKADRQAELAAVRYTDLERRYQDELQSRAKLGAQVEALTADNIELRAETAELRAEIRALRSRLNG